MLLECEYTCDANCPGACRMKCYGYTAELALNKFQANIGHCKAFTNSDLVLINSKKIDLNGMHYVEAVELFMHVIPDREKVVSAICILFNIVAIKSALNNAHSGNDGLLSGFFAIAVGKLHDTISALTSSLEEILIANPKRYYPSQN